MTKELDKKTPIDRLNYSGDLKPVLDRVSSAYNLGLTQDFQVIGVGYEDCNVVLETDRGKFVAKIFSKERKPEDITRYTTIMEKSVEAGVNHPPLLQTQEGNTTFTDSQANSLSLVVMEFVDGETFLDMDRAPQDNELRVVLEQAALVNRIDYKPPYIFDSWAIPNIKAMYDKTKQFVEPSDLKLVEEAIKRYASIPVDDLPHCFVHGDFTKSNVLKGRNGKIYILDFSVANWYPRIQELAVISANLLHDKDEKSLKDRTELVAEEYNHFNRLTPDERKYLFDYSLAGVAMEFMGAHQEKYINGNDTEETAYWFNLGREGLRKALSWF